MSLQLAEKGIHRNFSPAELMHYGVQIPAEVVASVWGEEATEPYKIWLIASVKHARATKWDDSGKIRDDYQPLLGLIDTEGTTDEKQAWNQITLPFPTEELIDNEHIGMEGGD